MQTAPVPVVQAENVIEFNVNIQVYNIGQYVLANCNEICFYNQGTNNLIINQSLTLLPTQSFSPGGGQWERDKTTYNISFQGAGVASCAVVRKFYNTPK